MIKCNHNEAQNYRKEIYKCRKSATYFIDTYSQIYDATACAWQPFRLWPAQHQAIQTIAAERLTVILKARQLGLTWLVLGLVLWRMLLHPAATVLLFSRRDEEAIDLLKVRLRGMYERLPAWLQVQAFQTDNDHEWYWSNGSRVLALPTTAGDSYSATLVVVDEADLVPDLDRLLRAVKPTIDGGGQMILLSRADKSKPQSVFKRIYVAAKQRRTEWMSIFLPWQARPDRDQAWYDIQKADILHRSGSLDDLHEQYPGSDVEALAPRVADKRLAPAWLQQCYVERLPLRELPPAAPAIPNLEVYVLPQSGRRYVMGADPAEGNPTSDDSALTVLDKDSGEEVAALAGKFQPAVLASHADALGLWYNGAPIMVERNNHGHAVLLWLQDYSRLWCLPGYDGKPGWYSNSKGKALLYASAADAFREQATTLHSLATFTQLALIEGATFRAPPGEYDDRADSYALACVACRAADPVWRLPDDYQLVWWPTSPRFSASTPGDEPLDARTDVLRRVLREMEAHDDDDDDPLRRLLS
jgi:hypothetical protein